MARVAKSSHTPNLFTLFSLHFHIAKKPFNSLMGSTAWECDSSVKSLTDAYTKLGLTLKQGNELTVEVTNYECILC